MTIFYPNAKLNMMYMPLIQVLADDKIPFLASMEIGKHDQSRQNPEMRRFRSWFNKYARNHPEIYHVDVNHYDFIVFNEDSKDAAIILAQHTDVYRSRVRFFSLCRLIRKYKR